MITFVVSILLLVAAYFVYGKDNVVGADQLPTENANAPTAQNSGYMPSAYNQPKFDEIKTDDLPF